MARDAIEIATLARYANEALILAVLARGDSHGYQLAVDIEEASGGMFEFNHGTLYPILHKLERDGCIKGGWKTGGTKRKRKYYTLTDRGRDHLAGLKSDWRAFFGAFAAIVGRMDI